MGSKKFQLACFSIIVIFLGVYALNRPANNSISIEKGNSFPLIEASILDIQAAVKSKQTSCKALVQGYLDRIQAYDKAKGIHAITVFNKMALTKADEADKALRNGTDNLPPLFCTPLVVKDNFDTHDMVTSGGSMSLKNNIPPDDAFMVQQLRDAGAIIIAKTNMAEWAFSPRQSISSSFGRTANAYNTGYVPAGSSGGTASAVAASFAAGGLGSDTGNSIRGPSSHLGLVGMRSTIGLTSRDGVIPLYFDRDIAGPMTRTVQDNAILFNIVAGYDEKDPYTALGKGKKEADYTTFLKADGLKGKRIGVFSHYVRDDNSDPTIRETFAQAVKDLEAAGAVIAPDFKIKNFDENRKTNKSCQRFRYDMGQYLATLGDNAPIKDVNTTLETGEYGEDAKEGIEWFSKFPMDKNPTQWTTEEGGPCYDYVDHPDRQKFLADVVASFDEANVDAIIYPSWSYGPAEIDKGNEQYKGDNSQLLAPATGMPAITVPMGVGPTGLPVGLQILGRPYSEGLLYQLAYAYEQATSKRTIPVGYPELGQNASPEHNEHDDHE
jgi:Asp-tRNA(Asn)/Glu-tRNA(Gln) amidotransferase A subunit family amidase